MSTGQKERDERVGRDEGLQRDEGVEREKGVERGERVEQSKGIQRDEGVERAEAMKRDAGAEREKGMEQGDGEGRNTRHGVGRGDLWLFPFFRDYGWRFGAATVTGVLAAVCAASLMLMSGYLISRAALRPENILMLYVPIVLVRTLGLGKAVLQYLERLIGHDAALRAVSDMRVRLYRTLEPQAPFLAARYRSGDLLGLLADDIEQWQNVYLRTVLPTLTAVFVYAAAMAALGRFDGTFALWMALYVGFLLFVAPAVVLVRARRRRAYKRARAEAYRELTDAVFGMRDWVLSGRVGRLLASLGQRAADMRRLDEALQREQWTRQALLQWAAVGAAALLAWRAGLLAESGRMAGVWIASFVLVALPLLEVVVRVADAWDHVPAHEESLRRLRDVERNAGGVAPSRELSGEHAEEPSEGGSDASFMGEAWPPAAAPEASGASFPIPGLVHLSLKRVSFRYPGSEERSVDGVTLDIPPGGRVALLGRSGSGKTTLLHLMQGTLRPEEGDIMVNGRPLSMWGNVPRRLFAVLNQRPHLFDTTVANNVRIGRPDASDREVLDALAAVGLGPLIESLPKGANTPVREAGARFSGGERRRMALARILLQNRPVVLLDEPTAGLDPQTEQALIATVFRVLDGKTIVWVTHRLAGMEQVDEIVFLERGRVSMRGTHEELMAREPRYRRLYALDRPSVPRVPVV